MDVTSGEAVDVTDISEKTIAICLLSKIEDSKKLATECL
jgi:hypothetical protein